MKENVKKQTDICINIDSVSSVSKESLSSIMIAIAIEKLWKCIVQGVGTLYRVKIRH